MADASAKPVVEDDWASAALAMLWGETKETWHLHRAALVAAIDAIGDDRAMLLGTIGTQTRDVARSCLEEQGETTDVGDDTVWASVYPAGTDAAIDKLAALSADGMGGVVDAAVDAADEASLCEAMIAVGDDPAAAIDDNDQHIACGVHATFIGYLVAMLCNVGQIGEGAGPVGDEKEALTLRGYREEDQDALLEVWRLASEQGHPFLSSEFLDKVADDIVKIYLPNTDTTVLEYYGVFAGFVSVIGGEEIGALFVHPMCQGRGGGRMLIDHAHEKYGQLELDVFEANDRARRFYAARGFVEVGEAKVDEASGFPVVRMRLP